jgi:hypothetical protein
MGALNLAADSAGRYVTWGVIQISVTNLVIIAAMIVLFVLAILVPFPHARDDEAGEKNQ